MAEEAEQVMRDLIGSMFSEQRGVKVLEHWMRYVVGARRGDIESNEALRQREGARQFVLQIRDYQEQWQKKKTG
jgi:hypothetical protein